jgi:hypothetical protein
LPLTENRDGCEPVKAESEGASECLGVLEVGHVPSRVEPRVDPVPVSASGLFYLGET